MLPTTPNNASTTHATSANENRLKNANTIAYGDTCQYRLPIRTVSGLDSRKSRRIIPPLTIQFHPSPHILWDTLSEGVAFGVGYVSINELSSDPKGRGEVNY